MSLTSLINSPDVRQKFKVQFPHQPVRRNLNPIAPPLSDHPGLVGTAFDYLLRFYIKRLNPIAKTSAWVAEKVPDILKQGIQSAKDSYALDQWTEIRRTGWLDNYPSAIEHRKRRHKKAERIVVKAKRAYSAYLRQGSVDTKLLRSVLLLAQLDTIYRSGQGEYELGKVDQRDLSDLKSLIRLVNPKLFMAKKLCVLNPTFGTGSRLVGGGDADLLIDNTLIEVKTTNRLQVRRDHWNQLIGYYVLAAIGGVDGLTGNHRIQRLGIYFSRFGELFTVDVEDAIDQKGFRSFVRWFIHRAKEERLTWVL